MSEWGFENNDGSMGQGNANEANGPKALRDAYEAIKKQNEELSNQLTSFLEEQKAAKMATVFESLGVPGAQAVYTGPADPQKAKEWVDTMAQVFGGGAAPQAAEQSIEPKLPESMQAQFQRMSQAGADGQALGNVEAAHAAVNDANSVQGIIDSFKNLHS